jgi:hypothetical protein
MVTPMVIVDAGGVGLSMIVSVSISMDVAYAVERYWSVSVDRISEVPVMLPVLVIIDVAKAVA